MSKEDASEIIKEIIKEFNEYEMEGLPFEAVSQKGKGQKVIWDY